MPKYIINLDLPPQDRWVELMRDKKEAVRFFVTLAYLLLSTNNISLNFLTGIGIIERHQKLYRSLFQRKAVQVCWQIPAISCQNFARTILQWDERHCWCIWHSPGGDNSVQHILWSVYCLHFCCSWRQWWTFVSCQKLGLWPLSGVSLRFCQTCY